MNQPMTDHVDDAATAHGAVDYSRAQCHILLDMHVPEWDPDFLTRFDPDATVDLYLKAGADAVMVYCNSMLGLSYWPSRTGRMHPALSGSDIIGRTVERLHEHGIAACAYYSVNFNQLAYENLPAGRTSDTAPFEPYGPGSRFGVMCPNNKAFVEFACGQVAELANSYTFDALFLDMMFWTGVCTCANCQDRYLQETGRNIPSTVDWASTEWAHFQRARESWLADQYDALAAAVKTQRNIPVFNNNSIVPAGWRSGASVRLLAANDLIGADVQASADALFTFAHMASRLSPLPWQYMHSASGYLSTIARAPSVTHQASHAMMATTFGAQFMAIDAVMPDGTVHPAGYDRFREIFDQMRPYKAYLGGQPAADIAVYYNPSADVDLADNGTDVRKLTSRQPFLHPLQHGLAAAGACGALQRAHLPVTVVTPADLDHLGEFDVLVLPNLVRVSAEETRAFRDFVRAGGRLYASGYTSLIRDDGTRLADFDLADVLGVTYEGREDLTVSYLRPIREKDRAAIAPAELVTHGEPRPPSPGAEGINRICLTVIAAEDTATLGTLTTPFAEGRGTRDDHLWASVLTSPPWTDTGRPAIVEHHFGQGHTVYVAGDLEAGAATTREAESLFISLVRGLQRRAPLVEADAPAPVWLVPFDEPEHGRLRINLLNHQPDGPHLPVPELTLRINLDRHQAVVTAVRDVRSGTDLAFEVRDGHVEVPVRDLALFTMVCVEYISKGATP